jgi:hypothetical protein
VALLNARIIMLVFAGVLVLGSSRSGRADEAAWPAIVDEALQAYDAGMTLRRGRPEEAEASFRRAAERFAFVVRDGLVNGPVLYNLGNAHLQSGDVGRAIAAYRRAEQLMPGDDRLQANLAYARSLCRSRIESAGQRQLLDALLTWHTALTLTTRMTMGVIAWGGFWGLLAISLGRRIPGGRSLAAALLVLWIALGVSVISDVSGTGGGRYGVLVEDDVSVRKGGGLGYELQFAEPLHAGVELVVKGDRDEWLEVELPNGRAGWVRSSAVVRF